MKSLALHIDNPTSTIFLQDEQNKLLEVENLFLFKDPELFPIRLMDIVENNINNKELKFENIIFSLNGSIDKGNKRILKNQFLDYISYSNSYDGYEFDKNFSQYLVDSNLYRIQIFNHFEIYANGVDFFNPYKYPCLQILLHMDYQSGIVDEQRRIKILDLDFSDEHIQNLDSGGRLKNPVSLEEFMGGKGIYEILVEKTSDISSKYSSKMVKAVGYAYRIAAEQQANINSINIISNNTSLLSRDIIKLDDFNGSLYTNQPKITHISFGLSKILQMKNYIIN